MEGGGAVVTHLISCAGYRVRSCVASSPQGSDCRGGFGCILMARGGGGYFVPMHDTIAMDCSQALTFFMEYV